MPLSPSHLKKISAEVRLSGIPKHSQTIILAALENNIPDQIIRPRDLKSVVGLSKCHVDRLEREGMFPQRVRLGKAACGWRYSEIKEWFETRERGLN
ncbi:transcriptional regulator, AlpA family [Malonomonas rubra DSM 5091]|uniref:Transcriptional regulator, AlpA family n=1 Tax=Malonomonas rubra DSM 5091 TaxID=1122189 RepID=A0A1M6HNU3_MALRU|nr:AlpA family phage regulatory protein [Malonomonas rubra]SHJ23803.1 transcriptional regulator, AlpA family [Malonomonas rubra DSM 5091]